MEKDKCPNCDSKNVQDKNLVRLYNKWHKRQECKDCKYIWDREPTEQERLDWNG